MPDLIVRHVTPDEIPAALSLLLASNHATADAEAISSFQQTAQIAGLHLDQLWIALLDRQIVWTVLPVINAGRTAVLCAPTRALQRIKPTGAIDEVLKVALNELASQDIHLVQLLIEPDDAAAERIYGQHGFSKLADLAYLNAHVVKAVDVRWPEELRVISYSDAIRSDFETAMTVSYEQSMDCPGINGLRTLGETLDGYRSTGPFDPRLWRVVYQDAQSVAVLLLTHHDNDRAVEISYLGLAPSLRGKGIGNALVRMAKQTCYELGEASLTAAVDVSNRPAVDLYLRHGFRRSTQRRVLMCKLCPSAHSTDNSHILGPPHSR